MVERRMIGVVVGFKDSLRGSALDVWSVISLLMA